jgi:hypothetical protein
MSHKVNHKTPFHTISAPGDVYGHEQRERNQLYDVL